MDRQAQVDAIVDAAILPSKELTLEQEVFNRIDRDAQVPSLSGGVAMTTDEGSRDLGMDSALAWMPGPSHGPHPCPLRRRRTPRCSLC